MAGTHIPWEGEIEKVSWVDWGRVEKGTSNQVGKRGERTESDYWKVGAAFLVQDNLQERPQLRSIATADGRTGHFLWLEQYLAQLSSESHPPETDRNRCRSTVKH